MADFIPAFERMISNEGGYRLTKISDDRGGQTYAGIARNRWPNWPGWAFVDRNETPPTQWVRDFYQKNFWNPIRGDSLLSQAIAQSLFDFAVNAGSRTAIKLAQIVAGVASDGVIGSRTLSALNAMDDNAFRATYALAKIARYRDIVTKDRTQTKFLLGWINRTLKETAA